MPLNDRYHADCEVAIVLGYYDGKQHVAEQLLSIFRQTHSALHVFLFDDNSTEKFNVDDLALGPDNLDRLTVGVRPKNIGFVQNFLTALASIDQDFDFFAFSDQDDIWHADKLERALEALSKISSDRPALYCGRTEIIDNDGKNTFKFSPLFTKTPSFANALVQNIGGGNTMVLNKAAKDLIVSPSPPERVVSHDWWCYQIVSGAGGDVIYDPEPSLKYRQHQNNLVGENTSLRARFLRVANLLRGHLVKWNEINLAALSQRRGTLTKQNQSILADVITARQSSLVKRLALFKRSGIYRQTLLGNLGLFLGILLKKV